MLAHAVAPVERRVRVLEDDLHRLASARGRAACARPAQRRPSSSMTLPASGTVRPRSMRASVVLPQPDSPTSPSVSPGLQLEVDVDHGPHMSPRTRKVFDTSRTADDGLSVNARSPELDVGGRGARQVRAPAHSSGSAAARRRRDRHRRRLLAGSDRSASAQRSAKTHPTGTSPGAGRKPGIVSRRPWSLRWPPRGTQRRSPTV